MPQEPLNGVNIGSLIQEVSGETVTQGMESALFVYSGFFFALEKAF